MLNPTALSGATPSAHDSQARHAPAERKDPWLMIYQDRLQRAQSAQDPGLRRHFEAELAVMRPTLQAMGLTPPDAAADEAPAGEASEASEVPDTSEPGAAPAGTPMSGPAGGSYDELIEAAAQEHGVDPSVLKCPMAKESQGDTWAVSPAGALGLMQVKPSTACEVLGLPSSEEANVTERLRSDPAFNIDVGTRYFAQMLKQTGNLEDALGAYNQGPNADWRQSAEAQDYVQAITQSLRDGRLPGWGAAT